MDKRIRFKYNDKIYQTADLEKKLNQLGITKEDVELIIDKEEKSDDLILHHFVNLLDGSTITSVYTNLDSLKSLYNLEDWKQID